MQTYSKICHQVVTVQSLADLARVAEQLNAEARRGLGQGGAILVCPGVLEFLDRRGAGAAREALLEGLALRSATGGEGFRWIE